MDWANEEMPLVMGMVTGCLMRGMTLDYDLWRVFLPEEDEKGDYTNVVKLITKNHTYTLTLTQEDE